MQWILPFWNLPLWRGHAHFQPMNFSILSPRFALIILNKTSTGTVKESARSFKTWANIFWLTWKKSPATHVWSFEIFLLWLYQTWQEPCLGECPSGLRACQVKTENPKRFKPWFVVLCWQPLSDKQCWTYANLSKDTFLSGNLLSNHIPEWLPTECLDQTCKWYEKLFMSLKCLYAMHWLSETLTWSNLEWHSLSEPAGWTHPRVQQWLPGAINQSIYQNQSQLFMWIQRCNQCHAMEPAQMTWCSVTLA